MGWKSWWVLLAAVGLGASVAAACGDDPGATFPGGDGGDGSALLDGEDPFGGDSGLVDPDAQALVVLPQGQIVTVTSGQPLPTLQFAAWLGQAQVPASWSIDRGEIGNVNVGTGLFTPTGKLGGVATVTAAYQGKTGTADVTVKLEVVQNGDPSAGDAGGGSGGTGGVGGEGPGTPVSQPTLGVLNGIPVGDPGLAWLYPYDATVWPRGQLAPLLQWKNGAQADYDALYIHAYENAFDYKGTFSKTATPFIHHPIPQQAWQQLTYSNAGEDVTVDLVFAKGNVAYGPITEKWKVAKGVLKGIVYYNSYGTNLAKNYCCTFKNAQFGGATLAIKPGATSPQLVAGSNGGSAQCRVCHSVAADGSKLVTQHGNSYATSSAYDLKNNNAETTMSPADWRYAFPALSPDGTFLFSNSAPLPGTGNNAASALFNVPSGTPIVATGLPGGLRAGCPTFSPDGKHVSFNYYAGPNGDQKTLAAMDFAKPGAFSNLALLDTPASGRNVWPSFLPTSDAVVYQLETVSNGEFGATRESCGGCNDGSHGELWWVDLATKTAHRLDKANGLGIVPQGPNGHTSDATLSYEPTVNPVVSGGYAWVVFTSRRMYGNVATINGFWSDPRDHDISQTPTTKKLWVAAIDLGAKPGTDPSHPAFYLPAQEILAGNSRGFWVVDPCKPDGQSCETGDECCGGYCRSVDGGLVCTQDKPKCAQEFEKCTIDADCCGGGLTLKCINGRCAIKGPT